MLYVVKRLFDGCQATVWCPSDDRLTTSGHPSIDYSGGIAIGCLVRSVWRASGIIVHKYNRFARRFQQIWPLCWERKSPIHNNEYCYLIIYRGSMIDLLVVVYFFVSATFRSFQMERTNHFPARQPIEANMVKRMIPMAAYNFRGATKADLM